MPLRGLPRGRGAWTLDPYWARNLHRVALTPSAVRVKHRWILSQPVDRHEVLWRQRVGRAGGTVVPPGLGRCDLVAPAFQLDVDYLTAARGVVATQAPVSFGSPVPGTGRYPEIDYYLGLPPYLNLASPFPPMAE